MLGMEEILCELDGEDDNMLPPGFRFHPTDEELITFYLASKVFNGSFCGVDIAEVDLNRCEPWDLPEMAKMGEREWYFFSMRDKKYPTGLRTNRATGAGYWKATGKDREVYSHGGWSIGGTAMLLGMKKTLVFYRGRAPRGVKTKWVMHEYRLAGHFSYRLASKEEWVICRILHKTGDKRNQLLESRSNTHDDLPMENQSVQTRQQLINHLNFHKSQTTTTSNPASASVSSSFVFPLIINDFQPPSSCSVPPTLSSSCSNTHQNSNTALSRKRAEEHCAFSFKEQATVQKQCKAESNFSLNAQYPFDMRWEEDGDKTTTASHQNSHQSPLLSAVMRFPSTDAAATALHVSATAITTDNNNNNNRTAFQMLLNPAKVTESESWPFVSF